MSKIKLKMRIGVKRILSVFLTFMLVQVGVPLTRFTASAATTYYVNGGNNSGLQKKIDNAQNGDIIEITGKVDIKKTITIDKDITLKGNGCLVRNKRNKNLIIGIESGKLTMNDITIDGQGVKVKSSAVWVAKGCEFIMNSGQIVNNNGASGIRTDKGIVTINGGTISGNTAKNCGSGIWNSGGTIVINGGAITGNHVDNDGGGIYNAFGNVTLIDGTISGNTANIGGGIYNDKGTLTISGGTINKNTAKEHGSGIYNDVGILTINGGMINENTAEECGGGINNNAGTLTINGGMINKNIAKESGGGIYNSKDGTVTIKGGTINKNIAAGFSGGGICNAGTVTISEGTINENTTGGSGGGLYNAGIVTINGVTISGNAANRGGGIYNYGTLTMNEGTISENKVKGLIGPGRFRLVGGGVFNSEGGTLTMNGGTIKKNTARSGGGIWNAGTVTISEGTINENIGDGVCFIEGQFKVKGAPKIIDNVKNENDNNLVLRNQYITIEGKLTGQIGIKQIFDKVAVKTAEGYKITQEDLSCFKADEENAHLSLVNNEIMYIKNKTEWGQMVQKEGATYYVNENGRASAEVIGNGKIWLNTKIDGSGSWCGVDNSNGLFKIGSRFYFQVIDDANVGKYYDRIGKEYREKIESGKLKIFLIGVIDPDGNEYTTLDSDLICYVKIDPNWDKDKLRAIFINGEKTEEINIEYVETIESPSNGDKFAKLIIKHFSPYAIYQAKSNEAEVAQVNSNNISVANNFATGDSIEYVYILGLWAASVIALAGIVVAKRKFNK